jgi:signal transduction histidine kinase
MLENRDLGRFAVSPRRFAVRQFADWQLAGETRYTPAPSPSQHRKEDNMASSPVMQRLPLERVLGERSSGPLPHGRPEVDPGNSRQPALTLLRLLIHEISQPITALLGEVEFALRTPRGEKELQATFERCLRRLESVRRLVSDFRVAGEMNEAAIATVPLVGLINGVLETARPAAEVRHCTIRWHAPAEVDVASDPEVLEACLTKVLAKIIDACPTGKTIDVKLLSGTEVMLLEVSYPGPESEGAHSSATLETDSGWMLSAQMIQLLGGSLNIRQDLSSGFQVCVNIRLVPPSASL